MDENILKVTLENGNQIDIEVYDIIEMTDNNKKYIVYAPANAENDDMFISILNETENSFSLDNIEDDDEYKAVENFIIESHTKEGE